ncbi:hypothetical protein [Anaerorhabdus sp.]|uniref:hypothetical protein n=1 Tax=Anaerorhabdus sp. TaxID=1872524 RepID=UPI002FC8E627
MKKRILKLLVVTSLLFGVMPSSLIAEEDKMNTIEEKEQCSQHIEHTEGEEGCGYVLDNSSCTHVHDEQCGYIEEVVEILCDKSCVDTDNDGIIDHAEDCAYQAGILGSPCTHVHDDSCINEKPCTHICLECLEQTQKDIVNKIYELANSLPSVELITVDNQDAVWNIIDEIYVQIANLTTDGLAVLDQKEGFQLNIDTIAQKLQSLGNQLETTLLSSFPVIPHPSYYISYVNDNNHRAPEVTGTDEAPTLTFPRFKPGLPKSNSAGAITSKFGMDFNRDFEITGSVIFPERDGISFALHTTKNKETYKPEYSTGLIGAQLNWWDPDDENFTIVASQNNMTAGIYWDFMSLSTGDSVNTRARRGSYSYKINSQTNIIAFNDDTNENIKGYDKDQTDGKFSLKWERNNETGIRGKLTMTMGGTTFTYTDINAVDIFKTEEAASEVYFTLSSWAPLGNSGESKNAEITISSASYADAAIDGESTLSVDTKYYIDTDNNGVYETELKESTLVSPEQKIKAVNTIKNNNAKSTREITSVLGILDLSTSSDSTNTSTKITSIEANSIKMMVYPGNGAEGKEKAATITGSGPLNTKDILQDNLKVVLPAGGDGTNLISDARTELSYIFELKDANVSLLSQKIQIGVYPFVPAILSTNIYFNNPEALKPDMTRGKILFGNVDSDTNADSKHGVYRVVKKDKTVLTLFYSENSVVKEGLAYDQDSNSYDQSDLSNWLNSSFKNTYLSEIERASLINETITLPTNEQIVDNGTWQYTNDARKGKGQWWLSSSDTNNNSQAMAVDNAGTIVPYDIKGKYGVRPVIELNLGSILYITPTEIGKQSNGVGEEALKEIPEVTNEVAARTNYKLTLIDSSKQFKIKEANTNMSVGALETITLNYQGVEVGKDTYISAMISNDKGEDIYYGNLVAANQKSGELKIKIPSGLDGNYILKVFTETINQEGATDSASKFESIPLKIANLLKGEVTLEGKYQYGETIKASVSNSNAFGDLIYTWYIDGVKVENYDKSTYVAAKEDIGKNIKCEVTDKGDGKNTRNEKIVSQAEKIAKKDLVVKVKDRSIYLGSALPEINIEYLGYVGTDLEDLDTENVPFFKTKATYSYPESITSGSVGNFELEILDENIGELNTEPAKYYNLVKALGYLKVETKPEYVEVVFLEEIPTKVVARKIRNNRIASEDRPINNSEILTYGKGKVSIIFEEESDESLNLSLPSFYNLLNSVLTSEQLEQLSKGTPVSIRIVTKEKNSELTEQEQELIDTSKNGDNSLKTVKIMDISFEISFNNEPWVQLTEFNGDLMLTFKLDEEFQSLSDEWYLIHIHEGESTILYDIDEDSKTVTVNTGKNSIYALAYEDGIVETSDVTNQEENSHIVGRTCVICNLCNAPFGICLFVWGGVIILLIGVVFAIMKVRSEGE